MADGVWFVEEDHPVCEKCVSSLHRDERCPECLGEGWVEREPEEWDDDIGGIVTCPECFGEPDGYHCPTCKRHWKFHEIYPVEASN